MTLPGAELFQYEDDEIFRGFRWAKWLDDAAISIFSSDWSFDGPDDTLVLASPSILSDQRTRVLVKGGTAGATYTVINRIVTDESTPQKKSFEFALTIKSTDPDVDD